MKTVRLECPNCSSPDFEPTPLDANRCRCRHCGSYFGISEARPSGQEPPAAGARRGGAASAGMGVVLIAFAVTALLLAGGVAALVVMRRSAPPRHSYTYVPPPRTDYAVEPVRVSSADVEPEKRPSAELRSLRHGEKSGYDVWLGEVVNTGEVAIERPCARAVLTNAAGEVIADQRGYAHRAALGKGEAAPFLISAKKSGYAKAEVVLCELRAVSSYSAGERAAKVVEHKLQRGDFGLQSVFGTVENDTDAPLKFVQVVLSGRDADGTLVSVDQGYADVRELAAGKKSPFKMSVGVFATGTVARYEAYAVGMPAR